jgi:hypothetical protein
MMKFEMMKIRSEAINRVYTLYAACRIKIKKYG